VKLFLALGASAAVLGCGGGGRPAPTPVPRPTPQASAGPATPLVPLQYRIRGQLKYELERYDTLSYESMPGAPQISGKRAVLTVRPTGNRSGSELEIVLDSLFAVGESRLADSAVEASVGSRWQAFILNQAGPRGLLMGGRPTVLSGQIEEIVRLLLPQLPTNGVRPGDVWTDSAGYRLRVDAFDAVESAARSSRAAPAIALPGGVTVTAQDRISRTGNAVQGGQTMQLTGTGARSVTYDFAPEGFVGLLVARDSLDVVVTIAPDSQTIPVRWRSTLLARLRGAAPH
jgi:hypothetical protein